MRHLLPFVLAASLSIPAVAAPPALALRDLDGHEQSLEALRGKVVVLNFWATWCIPCRKEMPLLLELHDRYEAKGVQLIAASADAPEDAAKVAKDAERLRIDVPVWLGATTLDMERLGLGSALPATAIIDRDGTIVARISGIVDEADMKRRLDWLLGDRLLPAPSSAAAPVAARPKPGAASLVPS